MMIRAVLMLAHLLISLAVFALPNLTRREVLFGVVVPERFRSRPEGRHAIRVFRIAGGISTTAGLLALAILNSRGLSFAIPAGLSVNAAVALVVFVRLNRKLKVFAMQPRPVRELDLSAQLARLPWIAWLGIVPLVLLAAAAVYLHAHWNDIPARYPAHWGVDGQPNRWVDRSFRGVYGPLIIGSEIAAWLFGFALAAWYGSRRSEPLRKPIMVPFVVAEWTIGLTFTGISLLPLRGPWTAVAGLSMLPLIFLSVIYLVKKSNESEAVLDPTPNECWKGGMI